MDKDYKPHICLHAPSGKHPFLTTNFFGVKDRMPPNEGHDTGDPSWELTMTMVQQALAENDDDEEEGMRMRRIGPEPSMLRLLEESSWQVCPH